MDSWFIKQPTKRQFVVMWVLIGLIFIGLFIKYLWISQRNVATSTVATEEALAIEKWYNALPAAKESTYNNKQYDDVKQEDVVATTTFYPIQSFDPNADSYELLIAKGVPTKVAKNIVNYRNAGGKYYKVEQLRKLYAMNDSIFNAISKYAVIVQSSSQNERTTIAATSSSENNAMPKYEKKGYTMTNLNTATVEELQKLKGIGPGFANRIVNFRAKLGGFFAVEQLKEVYGFPDSTYETLASYWIIQAKDIKQLDINSVSEEELASHPYIGKQMAKNIITVRNDIGHFKEIDNLKLVPLLNEKKFRKIVPYIKVVQK